MTESGVYIHGAVSSITSTLLERVYEQEESAWRRLFDVYHPLVYCWARRRGLSADDSLDIVQEVFGAVQKNIGNFSREHAGQTFRGWLRTITENKIRDHWRKADRQPNAQGGSDARASIEALEVAADSEELSEEGEVRILYKQVVELVRGEFSEQDWTLFSRVVVDGRKAVEVAAEFDVSANKVYLAKSRILRRIRDEFGEEGPV